MNYLILGNGAMFAKLQGKVETENTHEKCHSQQKMDW